MRSAWTAKADVGAKPIIWMAVVLAGLILFTWFLRSGSLLYLTGLDSLDKDLLQIQLMVDDACNSIEYYNSYNPITEKGNLSFASNEICISIVPGFTFSQPKPIIRCSMPICNIGIESTIDMSKIREIIIQKNGGFAVVPRLAARGDVSCVSTGGVCITATGCDKCLGLYDCDAGECCCVEIAEPTCQSHGYQCCDSCLSGPYLEFDSDCAGQVCCDVCAQPGAETLTLEPSDYNPSVGSTVDVAIVVNDIEDLVGAEMSLKFDSTRVEYTSMTPGSFLDSCPVTPLVDGSTVTNLACIAFNTGRSGSGTLITLTFNTIAGGSAGFSLSDVILVDSEGRKILPVTTGDATIEII